MRGKTHLSVGVASAMFLCQPGSMKEICMGAGLAAAGALICDIDVGTSESHKKADLVIGSCVLGIAALGALQFFGYISLSSLRSINLTEKMLRMLAGFVLLLVLSAIGKECSHRGFMHSFAACAAFSWCIHLMMPSLIIYFTIGFLSHLVIDLLNRKGLRLLFPLKKRFCFDLFAADGLVDRLLDYAGRAVICLLAVLYFLK